MKLPATSELHSMDPMLSYIDEIYKVSKMEHLQQQLIETSFEEATQQNDKLINETTHLKKSLLNLTESLAESQYAIAKMKKKERKRRIFDVVCGIFLICASMIILFLYLLI